MSTEQRETLDAILRQSAFPAGSDVNEQRRLLRDAASANVRLELMRRGERSDAARAAAFR